MHPSLSKKLWLIFAQTTTLCLAVLFVLRTFAPHLLEKLNPQKNSAVLVKYAEPSLGVRSAGSYSLAVKKAMPAVVNVFTSKKATDNPHQKYLDEIGSKRKTMVSTGDRSAKIRTYNYPQGRITDHRINFTIYNLSAFMNGDIQSVIDSLIVAENAERLKDSEL